MALNLLSCLNTLATHPPLTMEALAGSRVRKYDKDEFNCVVRFNGKYCNDLLHYQCNGKLEFLVQIHVQYRIVLSF